MENYNIDAVHFIFNYSDGESEKPFKSTMVSRLITHNEEDDFNPKEGEYVQVNGFNILIQLVKPHPNHLDTRIIIGVVETILDEDTYDSIIEWFLDNNWECNDSHDIYDGDWDDYV